MKTLLNPSLFKRYVSRSSMNLLDKRHFLMVLMLTLGVSAVQAEGHSMWVWERAMFGDSKSTGILDDSSKAQELIDFCLTNNITEVYLATEDQIPDNHSSWASLIEQLHNAEIKVQALLGTADWLMPTGGWGSFSPKQDRAYGLARTGEVLDYQMAASSSLHAFDGVQFDIEIETVDGTDPSDGLRMTQEDRVRWYLEFINSVKSERASHGFDSASLPYEWAISMNYDRPKIAGNNYTYPAPRGTTKPAWQHLFDQFERITFLTYADRPRFIAAGMRGELDYLDDMSNPPLIRFSHEFQRKFRGDALDIDDSVYNEDYLTVINIRQYLDSVMADRPYYEGWAIHTYDNEVAANGQFTDWLTKNNNANKNFTYPSAMPFTAVDNKVVARNSVETIRNPVYVRLNIKAHYNLAPNVSTNNCRDMIGILVLGTGYSSEQKLIDNRDAVDYDGIAPNRWFYLEDLNWTTSGTLLSNGICWDNPATISEPNKGVERDIILEEGEIYRMIVTYNDSGDSGINQYFLSAELGTANPVGSKGDSFDRPVEINVYLDSMPNYNGDNVAHLNGSFVIQDSDLDGLSNGTEMQFGTDPFTTDSANAQTRLFLDGKPEDDLQKSFYYANRSIEAFYEIEPQSNVDFRVGANGYIVFGPGFKAKEGSRVTAKVN